MAEADTPARPPARPEDDELRQALTPAAIDALMRGPVEIYRPADLRRARGL